MNIKKELKELLVIVIKDVMAKGATEERVEDLLLRTCREQPVTTASFTEVIIGASRELWEECGRFSYPFPEAKFRAAISEKPEGENTFGQQVGQISREVMAEYVGSGRGLEEKFKASQERMEEQGIVPPLDVSKKALLQTCRMVCRPLSELEMTMRGFRRVWENVLEVREEFPEAKFRAAFMEGQK